MATLSLLLFEPESRQARQRLLVACGVSLLLHLTLLLGITVTPPGGVPGAAAPITARLETAAAPPAADSEPPPDAAAPPAAQLPAPSVPDAPAQPAETKAESRPDSMSPAPESAAAAAPRAPPGSGLELPLIRDPVYYPARQLDVYPQPLAEIRPTCPTAAVAGRISGRVQLLLLIDEFGVVNEATVVDAQPEGYFEDASLPAFRAARFAPAQKQGHNVKSRILLRVNFLCADADAAARG